MRLTESGSPTFHDVRSSIISHARRKSSGAGRKAVADEYNEEEDGADDGFVDDFDDFEEGEEDAEFGDFDDGFQEAEPAPPPPQAIPITPSFVSSQLDIIDQICCASVNSTFSDSSTARP